ncbi:MAG: DUF4278 domain-containing protein [Leptolyngbyaceae cyanobacterium]
MRLCYRGVKYDYTPPVLEVSESEILGQYRGRQHHFAYVRHVPFPQPEANLKFRGAAYHTTRQGEVETAEFDNTAQQSNFTPVFDSMAAARRSLLQEAADIHKANIKRSLERRIQVAQSKGDEQLLRKLESEMHEYA